MTPQQQMTADGLVHAPCAIAPGRFQRFPGIGKQPSNQAGWCYLSLDESVLFYGDFSSGLAGTWFRDGKQRLDAGAIRRAHKALQRRHAERERHQAAAAIRAQQIWDRSASACPSHAYLKRKAVGACSARQSGDALILDIRTIAGCLTSLQFIQPDGSKRLLSKGRKAGCAIRVQGDLESPNRLIVCEGWATGGTLAAQYPEDTVLAAIDAGNLKAVAIKARKKWTDAEIVIAADDDRLTPGNPGMTKARAAAIACNGKVARPQWPDGCPDSLTDFNDLDVWLRSNSACESQS